MAHVMLITLYDQGALGARHLSAELKEAGHRVSTVYFKRYRTVPKRGLKNPPDEEFHEGLDLSGRTVVMGISSGVTDTERRLLAELTDELAPDLIGVSTRSITMSTAAMVTRDLKQRTTAPVVWGGIGPTLEPARALRAADYICIGEGDGAMLDLARATDEGGGWEKIANIHGNARAGHDAFQNPPRPLIRDLDTLPFADMAPEGKYTIDDDTLVRDDPAISNFGWLYEITSSRGCPFSCTYCCNESLQRLYKGQPHVRRRSVEHVVAELAQEIPKQRIERVNFQDDVFSMQPRWLEEFAARYKEALAAPFWCYVHPTGLRPEVLEHLRNAGLKWATLGIQSGSPRVLQDIYGRRDQRDAIIETSQLLVDLGVDVNVDIITNNPLETDDDCRETLEMLLMLPAPVRLNAGISKLSLFPGTRIAQLIDQYHEPQPTHHEAFNTLYLLARQSWVSPQTLRRLSRSHFALEHPALVRTLLLPRRAKAAALRATRAIPRAIKSLTPQPVWNAMKRIRGR